MQYVKPLQEIVIPFWESCSGPFTLSQTPNLYANVNLDRCPACCLKTLPTHCYYTIPAGNNI